MERRTLLRAAPCSAARRPPLGGPSGARPLPRPPSPARALRRRSRPADANGLLLPAGFTSRIVARSGQAVPGTGYTWHSAPDGGACFPDGTGLDLRLQLRDQPVRRAARRAAASTPPAPSSPPTASCPAPARTAPAARPRGTPGCPARRSTAARSTSPTRGAARRGQRPAMGRFKHEAAAADPVRQVIYLTEDETDGCFYRFVPDDLGRPVQRHAPGADRGRRPDAPAPFTWANVPDPDGSPDHHPQPGLGRQALQRRRGLLLRRRHRAGSPPRATTGSGAYDAADADTSSSPTTTRHPGTARSPASTTSPAATGGDLFVAEDGGNMEICIITPATSSPRSCGSPASAVRDHRPGLLPDGTRLYFSSQRGTTGSSPAASPTRSPARSGPEATTPWVMSGGRGSAGA